MLQTHLNCAVFPLVVTLGFMTACVECSSATTSIVAKSSFVARRFNPYQSSRGPPIPRKEEKSLFGGGFACVVREVDGERQNSGEVALHQTADRASLGLSTRPAK